jgi:KipI family sensor histidine kinase inhibitor
VTMTSAFEIASFGGDSVLITINNEVDVPALAQILRAELPDTRVRLGLESILVTGTDLPSASAIDRLLSRPIEKEQTSGEHHQVPVTYDGEDLRDVASALNLSVETLVALHTGAPWQVAMLGFAPGFPYLRPVSDGHHPFNQVPRLPTPRTRVPAGSVAVAAGMSCIYPNALPGGWNLLGRTTLQLFDPSNDSRPALLRAGDVVQFTVESP